MRLIVALVLLLLTAAQAQTETPTPSPSPTATPTCGSSPFVVTNTLDGVPGPYGSLRWAEACADANADVSSVTFNITGAGQHTITLTQTLAITQATTTVDGSTQSGSTTGDIRLGQTYVAPTWNIAIVLDPGVVLQTSGTVIGVEVSGVDRVATRVRIRGTVKGSYLHHMLTSAFLDGAGATLGGPNAGDGNVVNDGAIENAAVTAGGCTIQGNYLCTDPTGMTSVTLSNTGVPGVRIEGQTLTTITNNLIGVCSTLSPHGIALQNGGAGFEDTWSATNTISGNWVGVDRTGAAPIGGVTPPVANALGLSVGAQDPSNPTPAAGTPGPDSNTFNANTSSALAVGVQIDLGTGNSITNNNLGVDVNGTPQANLCDTTAIVDLGTGTTISGNIACDTPTPTPTPVIGSCCFTAPFYDLTNIGLSGNLVCWDSANSGPIGAITAAVCTANEKLCAGGSNSGNACTGDPDCPDGGTCFSLTVSFVAGGTCANETPPNFGAGDPGGWTSACVAAATETPTETPTASETPTPSSSPTPTRTSAPCGTPPYVISTTTDSTNAGTLRWAVSCCNGDTLTVPAGTYDVSPLGVLPITRDCTLNGAASATTIITGNDVTRVILLPTTGETVTFNDVTITHGQIADFGAGIAVTDDNITLNVNRSVLDSNVATGSNNGGAAIDIEHSGDILNARDTTFSNNAATGTAAGGGALTADNGATVAISHCTFVGNTVPTALNGGIAISSGNGSLTVSNSTFTANTGSSNNPAPLGVVSAASSTANTSIIKNTSFKNNTLTNGSGGTGDVTVRGSGTTTCTVSNTIISDGCATFEGQAITSGGHNIDTGTSCGFTATGDQQNTDPLLNALANNGGPTDTMSLQGGSPAINGGDDTICAAAPVSGVDQRGYGRPGTGQTHCSVGAFEEAGIEPSPTPTETDTPTATPTGPTPTNTITPTPTPTAICVGASLCYAACPTPPCHGTPVPAFDGYKTAVFNQNAGSCTQQVYCQDVPPQSTPVPVCAATTGNGICNFWTACPSAYCSVDASDASCVASCWIGQFKTWTQVHQ